MWEDPRSRFGLTIPRRMASRCRSPPERKLIFRRSQSRGQTTIGLLTVQIGVSRSWERSQISLRTRATHRRVPVSARPSRRPPRARRRAPNPRRRQELGRRKPSKDRQPLLVSLHDEELSWKADSSFHSASVSLSSILSNRREFIEHHRGPLQHPSTRPRRPRCRSHACDLSGCHCLLQEPESSSTAETR